MPVYDLGLELFRENVASSPGIKERLLDTLLELIHKERIGEAIHRSLVKSVTQMLVDLGYVYHYHDHGHYNTALNSTTVSSNDRDCDAFLLASSSLYQLSSVNSRSVYEEDFEKPFLDATATFYRVESQEFIFSNSCPDYMRKVEARRQEELDRVRHYLDSCSEHKVKDVVERELITNHIRTLVEMEGSGLVPMLRDGKIDGMRQRVPCDADANTVLHLLTHHSTVLDLARMYFLFSKVKGQDMIKEQLSAYIRDCGRRIVQDEERMKDPRAYVQALLDLKTKYDQLLAQAFLGDKTFQHAINQAFEYFINLNPKSPEFISLFIDDKLKRGAKEQTEEEMDEMLDKVGGSFSTCKSFIND
jgi:cullin 3